MREARNAWASREESRRATQPTPFAASECASGGCRGASHPAFAQLGRGLRIKGPIHPAAPLAQQFDQQRGFERKNLGVFADGAGRTTQRLRHSLLVSIERKGVRLSHAAHCFGIPMKCQAPSTYPHLGHTDAGIGENGRMRKTDIRQVLARNLQSAMDRRGVNQQQLAALVGISQSHLSEVRRGISSITADLLNELAFRLGIEPWELLADSQITRINALSKLITGAAVNIDDIHYQAPTPANMEPTRPRKEVAAKRRKKGPPSDPGAQA